MLRNYLKVTWRNVVKHKSFSTINLFGLIVGLSSALVLGMFAYYELTFDQIHEQKDRIFLVYKERKTPDGIKPVYETWVPTLDALKSELPAVQTGTRYWESPMWLEKDGQKFRETVVFADPSLFRVFHLPLMQGDGYQQLTRKSSVLIAPEIAQKYFGEANPVGQLLQLQTGNNRYSVYVAGVLQPMPGNSSIRPAIILPFANAMEMVDVKAAGWDDSFLYTYVLLSPNSRPNDLEVQFPAFVNKVFDKEIASRMWLKLLPFSDLHNQFNQSEKFAYILLCIAFIIILIATINYVNLATVRSIERTREIGVRKVLGARKGHIVAQFLGESFLLTGFSFGVALLAVKLALPLINQTLDTQLPETIFSTVQLTLSVLAVLVGVALFAGGVPALYISGFRPIEAIKGQLKQLGSGTQLRKLLVVSQFALAVMLICATLVVYRQISFMKTHALGFSQENIVVIPTNADEYPESEAARLKIAGIKKELLGYSGIKGVTTSANVPGDNIGNSYTLVKPVGWTAGQPFRIRRVVVDESYFSVYGIKLVQGTNFTPSLSEKDSLAQDQVILNEAALKAFGWQTIDGKSLDRNRQVVGVVNDHHYASLTQKIEPIMFLYRPTEKQASTFVSVKFATGQPSVLLGQLEKKWRELDPGRPFPYFFVDENYAKLYQTEERNGRVITYFSVLAICIACLGLYGLVAFTAKQRTKEIGIRKVLGASVTGIIALLSKDFLKLVILAIVIALPIAWWGMSQWLADFAYRIDMAWWMFAGAGGLAIGIALLTVSFQSIKAALMNPVKSLRTE
ncbi:ABC transporter permease [Spirosoma areae]